MAGFPLYRINDGDDLRGGDAGDTRSRAVYPSLAEMSKRLLRPPSANQQQRQLRRMVETEIIPRLMLAHSAQPSSSREQDSVNDDVQLGEKLTESFAHILMQGEHEDVDRFVDGLLNQGVDIESIFMELIAPAARLLGEYWDNDSASFMEVTIGLGKLQHLVRTLGYDPSREYGDRSQSRSILLAAAPGEQHTLGLFMIEELFSRSGWRCRLEPSSQGDELDKIAASRWFDAIGLTMNSEDGVDGVTASIRALRRSSRNQSIFIIIGGLAFIENPELALVVGADATAPGGIEALNIVDNALNRHITQR